MEEEIVLMEENDIEEINIEEENYSGKPYELPIASEDVLGGVKVGENLIIDEEGKLTAIGGSETSNVVISPTEPLTNEPIWFQKSVNLFNKETAISNARIISNGDFQLNEIGACSSEEYTPVKPNTQYCISGINNPVNDVGRWYHFFYDINKQPISGVSPQKGTQVITTPENAYYMRFTFPVADLNTFQFEKGSTASEYQPYVDEEKIYIKTNDSYEEFKTVSSGTKSMLTASLPAVVEIAQTDTVQRISSFVELTKIGNKFSVENGEIKVGAGVNKIKVSYSAVAQATVKAYRTFTYLMVNNDGKSQESYYFSSEIYQMCNTLPPVIIDVKEGDKIALCVYGYKGNRILGATTFVYWTQITVEEL